jgi:hypothetical protein
VSVDSIRVDMCAVGDEAVLRAVVDWSWVKQVTGYRPERRKLGMSKYDAHVTTPRRITHGSPCDGV